MFVEESVKVKEIYTFRNKDSVRVYVYFLFSKI